MIDVQNLTRIYGRDRSRFGRRSASHKTVAIKDLTFSIGRRELFGLLGPNGAGKTTTIKILATLLLPSSGSASVNGHDVVQESQKVRQIIGVVLGAESSLYSRLTIRDNLWFFSRLYSMPKAMANERIDFLIDLVELRDRENDRIETLSKGMKQKVQIARGLINDPDVIFLDEPTLGLDVTIAVKLRRFIKEILVEKLGKTVMLTTHYMHEAEELCDRVAIIDKGNLIALDKPKLLVDKYGGSVTLSIVIPTIEPNVNHLITPDIGLLRKILVDENSQELYVEVKDDTRSMLKLVESFRNNSIPIESIKRNAPDLEAAFIKLVEG